MEPITSVLRQYGRSATQLPEAHPASILQSLLGDLKSSKQQKTKATSRQPVKRLDQKPPSSFSRQEGHYGRRQNQDAASGRQTHQRQSAIRRCVGRRGHLPGRPPS